jgi:hypothetical protein
MAEDDSVGTTRAERDEARRMRAQAQRRGEKTPERRRPGRTRIEDRPPAPWGKFPLVELVVLLGIIFIVIGAITWGRQGQTMIAAGVALASLGGLELSIREHFGGFRSHTTLLAGAAGVGVMVLTFVIASPDRNAYWIPILLGVGVFALVFWLLRQVFKRRSGGVGFRVR